MKCQNAYKVWAPFRIKMGLSIYDFHLCCNNIFSGAKQIEMRPVIGVGRIGERFEDETGIAESSPQKT